MKKISHKEALNIVATNDPKQWELSRGLKIVEGNVKFSHAEIDDGFYTHHIYIIDYELPTSKGSEIGYRKNVTNPISFSEKIYNWLEEKVDLQSPEVYARINAKYGKVSNVWVSNKGNFFVDNKKVKGGKLLRTLNPDIAEYEISDIHTELEVENINFDNSVVVSGDITKIYNSTKLKVGSCMTRKGFSFKLLEDLGIKILIVQTKRGDIIGRCLLHEGKYFDRIYSTSNHLSDKLYKWLSDNYEALPNRYKTKKVKVSKDTFYPYMDSINILKKYKGGFISLQNWESSVYRLNSTSGSING